ncbi:4-hydroxy-tetrahydrodipicolinate synthase [bacterium]|nr:4-hydroxy-tetrahydrodipicolinate synthase [bacterium]
MTGSIGLNALAVRFRGCGTALVTPFRDDGSLDEDALRRLVEWQIAAGIDFLVPCGSTGESAVLSREEHLAVIRITVEAAAGRVPVMAGAGGNNTLRVAEMARAVIDEAGADAVLSVTPYYNRPTQEGLFRHYETVAASVNAPIFLYNVPSRTGVNLLPGTVLRLSEISNIAGVKEASGNIDQISELAVKKSDAFILLSGDDANTIPILSLGGVGLISVVSNEMPAETSALVRAGLEGAFGRAMEIQKRIFPLMRVNFIETSPAPVKAALASMGRIREVLRLPLVPVQPASRARITGVLSDLGLLQTGGKEST